MRKHIEDWFDLEQAGSSWSAELRAGATTFLTMSYILFVNPTILGDAIHLTDNGFGQLLTTTALAAALGSILMGVLARYPYALAPGMGINAYFAYTVVLGQGVPWQTALGAVFLSGLLFVALSLGGVRDAILRAIPHSLRTATAAGIGLFLATIGAKNAGLIVGHPATLLTMGDPTSEGVLLLTAGLVGTAVLLALRVSGAILFGILGTTALAIGSGAPVYQGSAFAGLPGAPVQAPVWPAELVGALDISGALGMGLLGIVFTFTFVDLFDTAGTLVGLSDKAGFSDASGELPRTTAAFTADALATTAGAVLGTSSTTSYIESAAGIEAGGRTGLTAIFVGLFFLASLVLWPLASVVPAVATAPALILVGSSMMSGLARIDWDNPRDAAPAFLTLIGMPLTFSIANGVCFGIISWTAIHLLSGRHRDVSWMMLGLTVLLLLRYGWLAAA